MFQLFNQKNVYNNFIDTWIDNRYYPMSLEIFFIQAVNSDNLLK